MKKRRKIMKEERIEILKMVADKKITVDEGERLLRALEKGEAEERESRSERFGHMHRGPCGRGELSWGESLEGLGFKAQEFFENAFGSVFGDEYWFEGYNPAPGPVEDLSLDGETTVVLTNPRTAYKHGSADVSVRPSEDGRLHLETGEKGKCEVARKENKIVIFCHHDAEVRVPASIGKVKVILAKGDAEIHNLQLPLEIRTVKGDVVVRNASHPLNIRAVKGSVALDLADAYAGKSDISAMDGDISVTTAAQFSGRVDVKVGKGDIRIPSKGVKSRTAKNAIFRTESVELGAGSADNLLNLRTMHGDVTVTSREDGR
jgi:DUF4097 and DUF4098 domain-containing protein YvlB